PESLCVPLTFFRRFQHVWVPHPSRPSVGRKGGKPSRSLQAFLLRPSRKNCHLEERLLRRKTLRLFLNSLILNYRRVPHSEGRFCPKGGKDRTLILPPSGLLSPPPPIPNSNSQSQRSFGLQSALIRV